MVFEKIKFLAANVAPKPDEVTYWVDVSANPYGGVIKYYDGYDWIKLDQDSIAEDYLKLRNKPTLNGVVIEGNKTSEDYNIPTPESVELVLNDFRNEINNIDEKVSNVSIKLDNYIEANEGNIEDIKQDIVNIQESLELILGESASDVIDKFNEILSFLEGYDDSQTLKGVISDLEQMINDAEDDISLLEKEIKAALDSHINDYNNPHQVTKEQVGLDQVDNTSDLNKPISTLTQQALDYEANLRDEMDTELMNRINVLQGEIDSAGKKIVTDIIDITQNNTSGVQLNYKYKDRVSFDDKYGDEKLASVLLNNASSTNNGVMSKEDKKKFDSIDSKIINDITSITYEPSSIKINYGSQNLQDGVYVKSSETKIINSATTSSAGAMSSEDKQTLDAVKTTYIPLNQKGVANGVATLDENALIPSSQLPSYVDDVIECFATFTKNEDGSLSDILLYEDEEHSISIIGEAGKIYVDITVRTVYNRAIEEGSDPIMTLAEEQAVFGNYQFRWTGTQFAVINASTVIGTIPGTAFDGGRGKQLEDLVNVINGSNSTEGSFRKADSDLQATINESISLLRDDINENVTSISEITNQINTINSNIQDVINGNVASATKLQTARLINGTAFDGTADIITNSWGEARNITIGNTKKSVNGSTDVSWSLEEIGMNAYTKTESDDRYVNASGDTITGDLNILNLEISHNNEINSSDRVCIAYRDTPDGLNVCYNNSPFTYGANGYKVWHEGNDGSGSGLDADSIDGYHRDDLYRTYNSTTVYGTQFAIGNEDNSWKKIFDLSVPTTGGYKGCTVKGTIYYSKGNHAQVYNVTIPFEVVFNLDGELVSDHSAKLYLPFYYREDYIRIVKVNDYAYELQVRQVVNYNNGYIYYQYWAFGCNAKGYNSTGTASSGTVVSDKNSAYEMIEDTSYKAIRLNTTRTIWGQSFDGTNNIDGRFTTNGEVVLNNGGELQMLNTEGGNWYIGYGAGGYKSFNIYEQSNSHYYIRLLNGNVGIGNDTPSERLYVSGNILATGKISASSGFYESSDIQLKTNIQPIDFTNNIELVSFNWKKDGSKSYGVIAQQVEEHYPELVSTDESTGYKSVNYDAVLIIKCAQLENRIKQLEKELEDLKNEQNCN